MAAGREHVWGQWDCSLYPANWILSLTGLDPAALWRGCYDDEEGALAFVQGEGGLIRTFARAAASVGLTRVRRPVLGAVGVLRSADRRSPCMGAVCVGAGAWSTIAPGGGLLVSRTQHLIAWMP